MHNLAKLYHNRGRDDEAQSLFEDCLARRMQVLGDAHPAVLSSINNLAILLNRRGDYKGAQALYDDCFSKRKDRLGEDHPDTLAAMHNLASVFDGEFQGCQKSSRSLAQIFAMNKAPDRSPCSD